MPRRKSYGSLAIFKQDHMIGLCVDAPRNLWLLLIVLLLEKRIRLHASFGRIVNEMKRDRADEFRWFYIMHQLQY